ncbi:MAG TPA: Spy/CpxP family protein refolding chaperone [Gemmatimonadales bacterium]|nr:Spy/CpxP family protein refolding chaperone [Gemmatimonadales bacterium]
MLRAMALGMVVLLWANGRAVAQHQHEASPYAGLESREIKALSAEQVAQYLSGEGMGFALAAELNHYPGPRHTLDLATALELSTEQLAEVTRIRDAMQADARRLGEWIVGRERALDQAFGGGGIDEATLRARVDEVARLQAELRYVHLRAHIAVRRVLTPVQVRRYDELRGYQPASPH